MSFKPEIPRSLGAGFGRVPAFMQPAPGLLGEENSLRAQAEKTAVADVMSRGVVCVAADASLDRVAEMLLERDIGSAPVVDAAWRPVGMISKTDLLQALSEQMMQPSGPSSPVKCVGDVAQALVLSLHEASPVSTAAAIMAYEGVHRLPVVNARGEVTGVVSSLAIVRWVARCTNDDPAAESL